MHYSLMDLVIKHDNFTFVVGHFNNDTVYSSLFGISIIKESESSTAIYFDIFYGYFLAYAINGWYRKIKEWGK